MRELPLDEYTAAVAAQHLGREPDERLRAACEIAQEKAQTLDEVWPLIRFLFEPPVEDEKAWAKVMKEEAPTLLEAAREALAAADGFDARRSRRRSRRFPSSSGVKPGQALPADPGRDHRHHRLARDLRVPGGARPRGVAGADRRRIEAGRDGQPLPSHPVRTTPVK